VLDFLLGAPHPLNMKFMKNLLDFVAHNYFVVFFFLTIIYIAVVAITQYL
jgi:hypothetical protein